MRTTGTWYQVYSSLWKHMCHLHRGVVLMTAADVKWTDWTTISVSADRPHINKHHQKKIDTRYIFAIAQQLSMIDKLMRYWSWRVPSNKNGVERRVLSKKKRVSFFCENILETPYEGLESDGYKKSDGYTIGHKKSNPGVRGKRYTIGKVMCPIW